MEKEKENHQLGKGLVHADYVLRERVHTLKKNAEALIVASKENGPEVNDDKTMYTVKSRDQNAGRIHSIETDISSFERVEEFKYSGTTLTYQNSIQG